MSHLSPSEQGKKSADQGGRVGSRAWGLRMLSLRANKARKLKQLNRLQLTAGPSLPSPSPPSAPPVAAPLPGPHSSPSFIRARALPKPLQRAENLTDAHTLGGAPSKPLRVSPTHPPSTPQAKKVKTTPKRPQTTKTGGVGGRPTMSSRVITFVPTPRREEA